MSSKKSQKKKIRDIHREEAERIGVVFDRLDQRTKDELSKKNNDIHKD